MIKWPELSIRAADGPWSQEEFSTLIRLTEVGHSAAALTEIVELIKSVRFPADMSFAVWGDETGSALDWSERRRFTDLTLKTAAELADAVGVVGEEIPLIYPTCLSFRLAKPMLFDV